MRTIKVMLSADTEDTLQKKIENYEACYPYLGYDTRLIKVSHEDNKCHAYMERLESCD